MRLDGFLGQTQLPGDLAVGPAAGQFGQHLQLPGGQPVPRRGGAIWAGRSRVRQCGNQKAGDLRVEQHMSGMDGPDRGGQRLRVNVLVDIARRARPQRGQDGRRVGEARDHEDPRRTAVLAKSVQRRYTVAVGHAQVEQHDVGCDLAGHAHTGLTVGRLADDLDVVLNVEECCADPGGPSDGRRRSAPGCGQPWAGTSTRTVVPPPPRDATSILSAGGSCPVTHGGQPETAVGAARRVGVEAAPVVGDLQHDGAVAGDQTHVDERWRPVPQCVVQGLLRDAVERLLPLRLPAAARRRR